MAISGSLINCLAACIISCPKEKEGFFWNRTAALNVISFPTQTTHLAWKPPGKEISSLSHDLRQWNCRTHHKNPIALFLRPSKLKILDNQVGIGFFTLILFFLKTKSLYCKQISITFQSFGCEGEVEKRIFIKLWEALLPSCKIVKNNRNSVERLSEDEEKKHSLCSECVK